MTDERGTSNLEKSIAAVTVLADTELLPAVVGFVRRAAHQVGLRDRAAEHLDRAVGMVCRNVIDHAFEPDEEGRYDLHLLRRPGQVVIAAEDRGLPFDYVSLREGSDSLARHASPVFRRRDPLRQPRSLRKLSGTRQAPTPRRCPGAPLRERTPSNRPGTRRSGGFPLRASHDATGGIL